MPSSLRAFAFSIFRRICLADFELGDIGEPPVRRDHGPVRAEQHLFLIGYIL